MQGKPFSSTKFPLSSTLPVLPHPWKQQLEALGRQEMRGGSCRGGQCSKSRDVSSRALVWIFTCFSRLWEHQPQGCWSLVPKTWIKRIHAESLSFPIPLLPSLPVFARLHSLGCWLVKKRGFRRNSLASSSLRD